MTLATAFRSLANGTITNWLYEDATDSLVARMRDAADIFLSPVEQPRARCDVLVRREARDDQCDRCLRSVRAARCRRIRIPFYAALREHAPVQYVESLDAYAVSRHADVRRVMHDHASFSSEAMAALVSRPVEIGREGDAFDVPAEESISIVGLDGADAHPAAHDRESRVHARAGSAELEDEMRTHRSCLVDSAASPGRAAISWPSSRCRSRRS